MVVVGHVYPPGNQDVASDCYALGCTTMEVEMNGCPVANADLWFGAARFANSFKAGSFPYLDPAADSNAGGPGKKVGGFQN